jgi:D-3-phosphoglycerate dehydrogenase
MTHRALILNPQMRLLMPRYQHLFDEAGVETVIHHAEQNVPAAELPALLDGIHGVIAGGDGFTEEVLAGARDLKVISKWGVGVDTIDLEAAERLGIQVYWSPGALAEPVADAAIGYALIFARRLEDLDRTVRTGNWAKPTGLALRTRTMAVVGVGNVGKAVVRRALAFGMTVIGNDPAEMPPDFLEATGIEMTGFEEAVSRADFICVCADLNPTSFHLIDGRAIELMKPTTYVINVARGKIHDEGALVRALEQRSIAGAALDVFESEPFTPDNPLAGFDNVLVGSHNAYNDDEAIDRVTRRTVENLIKGLQSSG